MAFQRSLGILDFDQIMLRMRSPEHRCAVFEKLGFSVTRTPHAGMKSGDDIDNAIMPFEDGTSVDRCALMEMCGCA